MSDLKVDYEDIRRITISNPFLNLSFDLIDSECDIAKLSEWAIRIEQFLIALLDDNGADDWKELPGNKISIYKWHYNLKRYIGYKKAKIKNENGYISKREIRRHRTLTMKFMEVAKKELPKELYDKILDISKEKLEKEGIRFSSENFDVSD